MNEDIIRSVIFNNGESFYSVKEYADISIESAIRDCIFVGEDGLPVVRISGWSIICAKHYIEYKSRVLSDGGTISNETQCKEFICSIR